MKKVLIGIRFDDDYVYKELLDWALIKVVDSGDSVVAVHVCPNSDCLSNKKKLLDSYLEEYEGACNQKQVALTGEVVKGNSIRKVIVREAKNHAISVVIVGIISKHNGLSGWTSVAKYCAKKLPPTTEVMAIYNGNIVFSRRSKTSIQDPKPRFCINDKSTYKDNHSEFGALGISETSRFSFDRKESNITEDVVISPVRRKKRGSLSSISLPAEDFTKQRPGWPLLQTASSLTQEALEARNMSVVQWVMTLPNRSRPSDISESDSELPKDLEIIFMRNSAGCKVFSHDVLKNSTYMFSSGNLIGRGGCNSVYKGILPDGKQVAVKILESSKESRKIFIQEVDIMTTLKHKRIAPLLGICVKNCDNNDLISVYDFMSKGNLEENLHGNGKENSLLLSWESRFRIAVGIAEGLNYLHNECPKPVIHRDIKSSNILLTGELEPQISDFGLATWGPTTSFVMDSDVVGTFGYIAPEYFMYGKVSDKIDVYAFGVVLLELLSGRKPIGLETDKGQESLVMWAKLRLENKDFKSILDPNLDGNIDEAQMQRMAVAAASCLTQASRLRPKMCQILNILKGEEFVDGAKLRCGRYDDQGENVDDYNDDYDDEVYPDSSAESHFSLAFLDVNNESTSCSSLDRSSPLSVEAYLRKKEME
ncbi:hypothetical protein OROHE_015502 [Orobanche hederae]